MHDEVTAQFDMEKCIIKTLYDNTFFCELSRHIKKVQSTLVSTAGVYYDKSCDNIIMLFNHDYFLTLPEIQCKNVIIHEFDHVVFKHIFTKKLFHILWNIATDLAINSIIMKYHNRLYMNGVGDVEPLPPGCMIPGYDIGESAEPKLRNYILNVNLCLSAEKYYDDLCKIFLNDEKSVGAHGTFDDHSLWDESMDDPYAVQKVSDIIMTAYDAVNECNGWSTETQYIKDIIDIYAQSKSISNWKKQLSMWVSSLMSYDKMTTHKRINKKYPYIHPGFKKKYEHPRICIAIDQSGSVSNELLAEFTKEVIAINKLIQVTIVNFDSHVDEKQITEVKKGSFKKARRTKIGGTDFNAPTIWFNKNYKQFDGLIIMTDGDAPKPTSCKLKRAWVLPKKRKLSFKTDECIIKV
jgi:predicted metal-dependent peptidase